MEKVKIWVEYTICEHVGVPPWCDLVEPIPTISREQPDQPAPPWRNRNTEDHKHEPRFYQAINILQEQCIVPSHKNQKSQILRRIGDSEKNETNSFEPQRVYNVKMALWISCALTKSIEKIE